MNWIKRDPAAPNNVEALVQKNSGMTWGELVNPKKVDCGQIENISNAAMKILESVKDQRLPTVIVGDYDVDGITSTAIMVLLLNALGVKPRVIIPKRFSDGYGISEHLLDGVENSFVICVDNGVAAFSTIEIGSKCYGNIFCIIDHHLPGEKIPPADVIVDPHIHDPAVNPKGSAYEDYCAAGLTMKLAECLELPLSFLSPEAKTSLYNNITVLAMLGTICDVMPLTGDNRRIVKDGLQIINDQNAFMTLLPGLRAILDLADFPCDEETVKFRIGPILNAAGRMYDAGSTSVLMTILERDMQIAHGKAAKMREINEARKQAVEQCFQAADAAAERENAPFLVLNVQGMHEGVVGIVAGKLAEKYRKPTILVTPTEKDPNLLKGSGRSFGDFDLSEVVALIREDCVSAGGHAGAAGVSVEASSFEVVKAKILRFMAQNGFTDAGKSLNALYYDMEIQEEAVPMAMNALKLMAPYGEGCERPVFVLPAFHCQTVNGSPYQFMSEGKHVKLFGEHCAVLGFDLGQKYCNLGFPPVIDVIGTLTENWFNGHVTIQLMAEDIRIHH